MSLSMKRDSIANVEISAAHIEVLRSQIDDADADILCALAKRKKLIEQVGLLKLSAAMPTLQIERWRRLIQQRLALGASLGLKESLIVTLFELLHQDAIEQQEAQRARLSGEVVP